MNLVEPVHRLSTSAGCGMLILAVAILAYRSLSLWQASDVGFALLMNGVGVTFLAVGLITIFAGQFAGNRLAGAYLICQSIHWGGPVIQGSEIASVALYILLSGVLAVALLLHFSIVTYRGKAKAWHRAVVYVPVLLASFVALGATLSLYSAQNFMAYHVVQDNLYALIALVILLRCSGPPRMFGYVLLAAWLPPILLEVMNGLFGPISIAGRGIEPINVLYIVIPLGFLLVQSRIAKRDSGCCSRFD